MADHPYLCDYRRGWCWNGVESSPAGVGGKGRVVGGWIMALYPESLLADHPRSGTIHDPLHWVAFWVWRIGLKTSTKLDGFGLAELFSSHCCSLLPWCICPGCFSALVLVHRKIESSTGGGWQGSHPWHFGWYYLNPGQRTLQAPSGPLANLVDWLRYSALYSAYQTEASSGWIQSVFQSFLNGLIFHLLLPMAWHSRFCRLPSQIRLPGLPGSRVFFGYRLYALLPFLILQHLSHLEITEKRERLAWLSVGDCLDMDFDLFLAGWRDQWDNPRYRLMMLLFQAGLSAFLSPGL